MLLFLETIIFSYFFHWQLPFSSILIGIEVKNMVQKPTTIALIIIGAVLCFMGIIMTMANIPILGFWGVTSTTPMGDITLTLNAFGQMLLIRPPGYGGDSVIYTGGMMNVLPGVMIIVGACLSFIGIRFKAVGIVGGIVAVVGPVLLIAIIASNSLTFTHMGEEMHLMTVSTDIGGFLPVADTPGLTGTILFGSWETGSSSMVWSLGASLFFPIVGGFLAMIGSGVGRRD